jgi:hypothetical protein
MSFLNTSRVLSVGFLSIAKWQIPVTGPFGASRFTFRDLGLGGKYNFAIELDVKESLCGMLLLEAAGETPKYF